MPPHPRRHADVLSDQGTGRRISLRPELALQGKTSSRLAGQVVIGIGPGRCGSTSLSQMLGTIPDSCCTHEGPPPIFWQPMLEQVEFHVRRFALLAQYHSVVSDVSHWWLNAVDQVWERLPEANVIGLVRDPEECAESFMRIQGFGKGSLNPWAAPGHDFWQAGGWDATYPSYPVPDLAKHDPDRVKLEQITRYVREYNAQMTQLAARRPDRVKLAPTDTLSSPEVQAEIFAMAKHRAKPNLETQREKRARRQEEPDQDLTPRAHAFRFAQARRNMASSERS